MSSSSHLLIKNMVCRRCVMTVEQILRQLEIPFTRVELGEVELPGTLTTAQLKSLEQELQRVGFELTESRVSAVVEQVKHLVLEYLKNPDSDQRLKLSAYLTRHIHYDYSYLSDLFSSIEGTTIEQYFILQRIEKVKELLVYDQLTLTEIAYQTGYSSVHHLSAQFKKVTGLTPSHFKKIGAEKRRARKIS